MNSTFKKLTIGLLAVGMGVAAVPASTLPVFAKTKAAQVISTTQLKKPAYHANAGYLYSSTKLTKKSHNAMNYLKTTFYATKSAKVKRSNGKTATYYYVKNKKGSVKGWIWHGNLTKINTKNLAQRKSDIKNIVAAIRLMSGEDQNSALGRISDVTTANTYKEDYGLPNVITSIQGQTSADGRAIIQATTSFRGRFDSVTNTKLKALSDRVAGANASDSGIDRAIASENLANALAAAVSALH